MTLSDMTLPPDLQPWARSDPSTDSSSSPAGGDLFSAGQGSDPVGTVQEGEGSNYMTFQYLDGSPPSQDPASSELTSPADDASSTDNASSMFLEDYNYTLPNDGGGEPSNAVLPGVGASSNPGNPEPVYSTPNDENRLVDYPLLTSRGA